MPSDCFLLEWMGGRSLPSQAGPRSRQPLGNRWDWHREAQELRALSFPVHPMRPGFSVLTGRATRADGQGGLAQPPALVGLSRAPKVDPPGTAQAPLASALPHTIASLAQPDPMETYPRSLSRPLQAKN